MRGFTLVEMLITLGIIAVILSFSSVSLLSSRNRSSFASAMTVILTDLNSQRLKAMSGDTEGAAPPAGYGIYFGSDGYTLFRGVSFSAADPANFDINLDPGQNFSAVGFPGSSVVFLAGSGEISGFSPGQATFTLNDSLEKVAATVVLNQFGTVVSAD